VLVDAATVAVAGPAVIAGAVPVAGARVGVTLGADAGAVGDRGPLVAVAVPDAPPHAADPSTNPPAQITTQSRRTSMTPSRPECTTMLP
jgi:hypothetical protein